jgi:heme-degrading monooxygenase HmoA
VHARFIRFQADPDRIDAATRHSEEVLLPLLRDTDGFRGFVSFGDRSTGAGIALSYWESEEAMRASEETLSQARKDALDDAGAQSQPTIEHYEVLLQT